MKIELHMIQNFAPSCLNRDDTNSPKDCYFGGVRRARISSQCIKRAIREAFREHGVFRDAECARRSKRFVEEIAKRIAGENHEQLESATRAAQNALGAGYFAPSKLDPEAQEVAEERATDTAYLLYLGERELEAIAQIAREKWDVLTSEKTTRAMQQALSKKGDERRKGVKKALGNQLVREIQGLLDGGRAADLGLFGRMLADLPEKNIDAACQVAHAISTNKIEMEMDFYTAVDELKGPDEDPGAGMMGAIGFNSACFYRYAVIDFDQLVVTNLHHDRELGEKSVEAFLRASATAIPSGKQNTFAAHNPPDLILADVRRSGPPLSLANAFADPARPGADTNLTQASVDAMRDYWSKVTAVYGSGDMHGPFYCGMTKPSQGDGWEDAGTLDELIKSVMHAVGGQGGEA